MLYPIIDLLYPIIEILYPFLVMEQLILSQLLVLE